MEYASMSEKILRTMENIFKTDNDLEDFTIVPMTHNTENRSPVLYEDHHFGLESWCIKYVYEYTCFKLFQNRKSLAEKKITYTLKEDLNYLIMGALFINPDVPTFWNMRRELVEEDVLSFEQEMKFSKLVLTYKTKSNEAFSYRRWLINRLTSKMSAIPETLLMDEIRVCIQTAQNTPNNYHSWTHKQWCISKFIQYFPHIIPLELDRSEIWITDHVSDNSGYHYRQFLIDKFKTHDLPFSLHHFKFVLGHLNISYDGEYLQFLTYLLGKPIKNKPLNDLSKDINYIVHLLYEITFTIESIEKFYLVHEPLWLHRRYILHKLLDVSYKYLGEDFNRCKTLNNLHLNTNNSFMKNVDYEEKQPKVFKSQPSEFSWTNMYSILCKIEKKFIEKHNLGSPIQCELIKRHERWLKYMIGLDVR